jgi:hypothetical protein
MNSRPRTVRLSPMHLKYIRESDFLGERLLKFIEGGTPSGVGWEARLPIDVAEEFRAAFTERLAKIGFDSQYEVTSDGKLLEDLIDLFYDDLEEQC